MHFDFFKWLMSPFVLMFVAVITGLLFGKIKFGKFNFGISGALFTGLGLGWYVYSYAQKIAEGEQGYSYAKTLLSAQVIDKKFFTLFLVLFVVSVGLLAAKDIGVVIKKYGAKFIILGLIITFVGASATYGMTLILSNASPYEVSGVYTGALTSSPGLAAAIETAREHSSHWVDTYDESSDEDKQRLLDLMGQGQTVEDVPVMTEEIRTQFIADAEAGIGIGHAIGYPFGVIVVIIAMNFFPLIFNMDVEEEKKLFKEEMDAARAASNTKEIEEVTFDLLGFIIACFVGYTIGLVKIDLGFIGLGMFSLGSTGGALIAALALGYIGKIGFVNFRMKSEVLGVIRQLSLAFFLAIVGLRYGFKVIAALSSNGAALAGVGFVVGVVALLVGFFVGRYVFKINWIMLSGAMCGGMTSTPGLGAAVDAIGSDDPAAGYGATYPFALLGMVIFTIILHSMPM